MKKMTKIILIVAAGLIAAGIALFCFAMAKNHWNFSKKHVTTTHTVTDSFTNISILTKTADIRFVPTDDEVKVVCYDQENTAHSVSVEDNTLTVAFEDNRKWYDHINIYTDSPTITVYLPADSYGSLSIDITTGDTVISGEYTFESMDISATTEDVELSGITCSGDITIAITTGDCELTDVNCKNLQFSATTGDLELTRVIAAEALNLNAGTGDISFDRCDAASITAKTTTGDIDGSLLSEKVFSVHNTTGDIDVPQSTAGGTCNLKTTTGDIEIEIVK